MANESLVSGSVILQKVFVINETSIDSVKVSTDGETQNLNANFCAYFISFSGLFKDVISF